MKIKYWCFDVPAHSLDEILRCTVGNGWSLCKASVIDTKFGGVAIVVLAGWEEVW